MFRRIKRFIYNCTHPVIGEVWQLHRVRKNLSSDIDLRKYEITQTRLESLINDCLNKGYEFVSIDDVYEFVSGKRRCKSRFISVTLDDGYEDNYSVAYPIFKKYNIPFCIYITKEYITGDKKACDLVDFKMLKDEQIVELSKDPLCTLGGHTKSHVHLSSLNLSEQRNEIKECNIWLRKLIGKPIQHFAFPYGDYSYDTIAIVKECDIKCSIAAWGGGVRKTGSVYDIPRVLVTENTIE